MAGGGLKVGDLYVAVTASIGDAMANLGKLVSAVEKTAKKVKAISEPLAQVGMAAAAGIAGTVAVAAKSNARLSTEVDKLKKLAVTLATDVGNLFEPLVRKMTQAFSRFVGVLQSLPPHVKRNVAEWVGFVAVGGVAVMMLGRVAGVVGAVAEGVGGLLLPALRVGAQALVAFSAELAAMTTASEAASASVAGTAAAAATAGSGGFLAGIGATLGPLLAVVAAVAALALLAGVLYKNWHFFAVEIQDSLRTVGHLAAQAGDGLVRLFTTLWTGMQDFIFNTSAAMLNSVLEYVKRLAHFLEPLVQRLGMKNAVKGLEVIKNADAGVFILGMQDGMRKAGEKLLDISADAGSLFAKGVDAAWQGAKVAGSVVADGVGEAVNDTKQMLGDIGSSVKDWAAGLLPEWLKNGKEAELHTAFELDVEPSKVGRMEMPQSVFDLSQGKDPVRDAVWKMHADALKRLADAAIEAGAALKDKFTAALGALPGLVETFRQGVTATGGVREVKGSNGVVLKESVDGSALAGVGAVALQLVLQSKQFEGVMQTVSGVLQVVTDFLGQLAAPLEPLIGALGTIVTALLPPLQPILDFAIKILQMLTPPLMMVGKLLQALQPLLTLVSQASLILVEPLRLLAGVALRALFQVLRWVGIALLTVVKALADAWNAIVKTINGFIDKAKEIYKSVYGPLLGDKGKQLIDEVYSGLKVGAIDTSGIQSGLNTLRDATWDTAAAQAAQAAATFKNTAAMQEATEALLNVPSAWKVAQARYNAQDAQESPMQGAGSSGGGSTAGLPTQADIDAATAWQASHMPGTVTTPERSGGTVSAMAQPTTSVTYQIVGYDIDRAIDATRKNERQRQADDAFRRGGTTVPGARLSYGV